VAAKLQVTIDCRDPGRLVRFWSEALGYVSEPPPDGFTSWFEYWRSKGIPEDELGSPDDDDDIAVIDPDGVGPRIWFQPVPEDKIVKNRLHLDIMFVDRSLPKAEKKRLIDTEVSRLVELGASVFRVLDGGDSEYYGVVLQDPEGNEFCVA
jgi:hypothetical protein